MNPEKKSAARGLARARKKQQAAPAAAPSTARTDLGGKLPGDESTDLFWESRVAAWLGLPRVRLARLRRRALREGEHWLLVQQEVVFTAAGIQQVRDFLRSMDQLRGGDEAGHEPAAPVGPPERKPAQVVKVFPNPQLMEVEVDGGRGLVRVRENKNFMAGMRIEVVRVPGNRLWQYTGRLPRSRGRM